MKVIKNINNNVSLCIDSKGREVVAFGKGIGFISPPYEIPLEKIDRTFYSHNISDYSVLEEIPVNVIEVSIKIVEELEKSLNVTMLSSAALSIADHINFAIKRNVENVKMEMPIQEDLKLLYPKEILYAEKALKTIKEYTGYDLPTQEVGTLALHFINSQIKKYSDCSIDSEELVHQIRSILEKVYKIKIDVNSFNYSRFVTHMDYLIKRIIKNEQIDSDNEKMYDEIKKRFEKAYECTLLIEQVFDEKLQRKLNKEERLYLMLHINRMCTRV